MFKWIDLSQEFYEGMVFSHALPSVPKIRKLFKVETDKINISEFTFVSHIGTHVDAPLHFIEGGKTIEQIGLEKLSGVGVVIDLQCRPLSQITLDDLRKAEPAVEKGDIVFIRTGWDKKYGLPEYHDQPYLSAEAADWLIEQRVKMVGIDAITVDMPSPLRMPGFDYPIHHKLLSREIIIVENLNLVEVAGKRVYILAFPLKIRGIDGAPARVVASLGYNDL